MDRISDETVDKAILAFLPTEGMSFNGIVKRFREDGNWVYDKLTAESMVHESLKRLEKEKKCRPVSYGTHNPMLYHKLIPWIIHDWAGNHKFPDKVFETFEDGVDFLAQQFPDDEEEQAEFEVIPKPADE